MDILELRKFFTEYMTKKHSLGNKSKQVIDFTDNYIFETQQHEIMIAEIYNAIDIEISYNQFIRALSKKWNLEKLDGGRLKLNTRYQKRK